MSDNLNLDRRQILALGVGVAAAAGQAATAQGGAATDGPDLSGKSILVTGSSSGFGRLGVEYYARQGAKVFATMRNVPRPEAEELRDLASGEGLDISVIEIDVTSDEQVDAGVAEALAANVVHLHLSWALDLEREPERARPGRDPKLARDPAPRLLGEVVLADHVGREVGRVHDPAHQEDPRLG